MDVVWLLLAFALFWRHAVKHKVKIERPGAAAHKAQQLAHGGEQQQVLHRVAVDDASQRLAAHFKRRVGEHDVCAQVRVVRRVAVDQGCFSHCW